VADVRDGRVTLWSASQAVHHLKQTTAMVLGVSPDDVRVIFKMGSGCYGLNGADTVSYDAALLSQAVGRPVRVQLSRQDEMAWENYGYAYVIDQRLGLDSGTDPRLGLRSLVPTLGSRPRTGTRGTWSLVFWPVSNRRRSEPSPATDPDTYENGSNARPHTLPAAPLAVAAAPDHQERAVLTHTPGPCSSPASAIAIRLQNTFAHESILDEAAAQAEWIRWPTGWIICGPAVDGGVESRGSEGRLGPAALARRGLRKGVWRRVGDRLHSTRVTMATALAAHVRWIKTREPFW
jgi:hypothetical protein